MRLFTGIIANGENPYTRPFQPHAADVYPPLYNIVVAQFSAIFGNTLQLHRAVSAGLIGSSVCLVGIATWKVSGSRWHGLAAAVLLHGGLLYFGTPVAGTNAIGVALFLAGLIVPWLCRFSSRSLVFGLLCGVLAFYSKQYFILGIAILCLYLFLYVSKSRALMLGSAFAFLLSGSLSIVHISSPYYLDNTLFVPAAAIGALQNWDALLIQLEFFVEVYSGILTVLVIVGATTLWRGGLGPVWQAFMNTVRLKWGRWDEPLMPRTLDYFWFCLFLSTAAFVFWLGKNPGNYMTYLFQLISPFFLIVSFRAIARLRGRQRMLHPLILVSFYQVYAILPHDFSVDMDSWRRVDKLISESELVLASPILVNALLEHDKQVFQNGHTFYFPLAVDKPEFFVKSREEDRIASIWDEYMSDLYRKIEGQQFDLLLISRLEVGGIFKGNPPPYTDEPGMDLLLRNYVKTENIILSMTTRPGGGVHKIHVFRPKDATRQ